MGRAFIFITHLCSSCIPQLLYEFNKAVDEDMYETMTRNWELVCKKLCPEGPIQPVNVVKVIERNIYHKKPALSVIQFSYVSKLQTMH